MIDRLFHRDGKEPVTLSKAPIHHGIEPGMTGPPGAVVGLMQA